MKKQATRPKDKLSLEGDGIIENFFHVLWAKDPLFGTIPSVYVPHTVIMRYNEPIAWYFMKDGGLKKKTKKNLNLEHVRDVFIRNKTDSGIVAVFMRYMKQENTEKPNVVFEYFNEKEFLEFISNNRQVNNGILQQFIQPKGDKNYIIKANWSPKLCFFEKIESLTKINDPKYDIYDRVLTIEAEKYHSKEGPVRGYVLPNKVQRICANIAQHVQNVSFESILLARMILHFKIDSNSRIWLLACTSLRLDHGLDEKINERLKLSTESVQMKYRPEDYLSKIKTPDNIKTNIIKGKPINMHKIFACLSCNIRLEPSSVFETPYRTIIEGYEWDHLKEKHRNNMQSIMKPKYNNIDEILERLQGMPLDIDDSPEDEVTSHIPPLIKKLYPKLKDVEYLVLRQHLGFLKKTAILCEECILHIQNSHEAGLRAQKQSQKEFYGTGRLKPENVKFRQEETKRNIKKLGISSQTMTSFPKFLSSKSARVKTEEGFEPSSARSKRNSELPVLYSELAAAKDYIATNPNLDNEGDYDDGNLSFNSDREVERPKELTNRVAVAIKMARPVTVAAAAKPKDTKDGIKKHIDLNPKLTNRRVMSISTLKNRAIIEKIAKKENSLSSASGLFSARSEQTRLKSHQSTSKELTELGVTQTTSSSIIQTLKIYMPKKKFLRAEYKSVKSISGANTDRTIDTVERILETEGNNSARDHYYHL